MRTVATDWALEPEWRQAGPTGKAEVCLGVYGRLGVHSALETKRCIGRGERSQTSTTDLNVPARLPLEIEVTGPERWLRG